MIVFYNKKTGVIDSWGDLDPKNLPKGLAALEHPIDEYLDRHIVDVKAKTVILNTAKVEQYAWAAVRRTRDDLLALTDYLMMLDYPISDEDRQKVKEYRQSLRDVTNNSATPNAVVWPEMPVIGK